MALSHYPQRKFYGTEEIVAIREVSDGDEVVLQLTGNLNENSGGKRDHWRRSVLIIKKGKPKSEEVSRRQDQKWPCLFVHFNL